MFRESYRADNERIRPDDALKYEISRRLRAEAAKTEPAEKPTRRAPRKVLRRAVAVALCAVLVAGGFGVWRLTDRVSPEADDAPATAVAETTTYEALYTRLHTARLRTKWKNFWQGGVLLGGFGTKNEAIADGASTSGVAEFGADTATPSHSETNTQVAGVDEGDVVKTDGNWLYRMRSDEVVIARLDGAETKVVARLPGSFRDAQAEPVTLYLAGDRLAVIRTCYGGEGWQTVKADPTADRAKKDDASEEYRPLTVVELYDISDPTAPKATATRWQTGLYLDSRLIDGKLYLFTQDAPCAEIDPDDPATFVPACGDYAAKTCAPVAAEDIRLLDHADAESYVVAAALDLQTAQNAATLSLFGWSGTLYASTENLYWMASDRSDAADEKADDVMFCTRVKRISFADGKLELTGEAEVPGSILNQFSCDEADGYFRIVTTSDRQESNVVDDDMVLPTTSDESENGLYVLDPTFKQCGALTGLAKGERVYSVRFLGDIAYFVTFRQIDPLFSVDLSDPTAPKLLGALKIPGFSSYLHPWGDGLLLGLGYTTAPTVTGGVATDTLKLSMFDIRDPADVREAAVLPVDADDSPANSDHHAVLVDPAHNLIGFLALSYDNSRADSDGADYCIYGYTPADGFVLRAKLTVGEFDTSARGLYAGDYLYLCGQNGLQILRLADLTRVGAITF